MEAGAQGIDIAVSPVDALLVQHAQAIVPFAGDVDDLGVLLDQLDGRQKATPLQAVLVEPLRRHVGCRNQRYAVLEERFQQSRQDHRIADVGNVELVETEHPNIRRQALRDGFQGIAFAERAQLVMHGMHEAVEMQAAFGRRTAACRETNP